MIETETIKVSRSMVEADLELTTSYLGGKREVTPEGYERVAIRKFDSDMVGLLMQDAGLTVAAAIQRGLEFWRYDDDGLEFRMTGVKDKAQMELTLHRLVVFEVMRRWRRVVGADYPDMDEPDAENQLRMLASALLTPPGKIARPRRPSAI